MVSAWVRPWKLPEEAPAWLQRVALALWEPVFVQAEQLPVEWPQPLMGAKWFCSPRRALSLECAW